MSEGADEKDVEEGEEDDGEDDHRQGIHGHRDGHKETEVPRMRIRLVAEPSEDFKKREGRLTDRGLY